MWLYGKTEKAYNAKETNMNSTGHLLVSVAKSILRMGACVWCLYTGTVLPLAVGFLAAEILGIVEELVDKRS